MNRTVWPAVAVLLLAGMVAAGFIGKMPPALPLLRQELGLTLVQAGWVTSTICTLGTVAALFFGGACDRLGHLRFTLLGLGLMILGGLLGALAQDYPMLLASRILEGTGLIGCAVAVPPLLIRSTAPRHFRIVLGLWSTYLPVGSGLAMLASPFLLPHIGWRGMWVVVVVPTALAAVLLWRYRSLFGADAHHRQQASSGLILDTLRRPGAWLLAIAFSTYTLQWFTLMVWLPSFLIENRHASPLLAAMLTTGVIVANVPGNLFGGWLVHRNVPRGAVITIASLVMLGCGAGIFLDVLSDHWRYVLCLVFTSTGGMLPAAVFSGVPAHAPSPRHIGTTNGLMVQGSNLGQFAGPPAVAAAVTAAGGWSGGLTVMAGGATLGIVMGLALLMYEGRRATAHELHAESA